jgi:hypothetical protein
MKKILKSISGWLLKDDRKVYLEFFALALLIFSPILKPGFVFALDLVFAPNLKMPAWFANDFVIRSFFSLLNIILPSSVIEKLLLFSIVILSGVGMYKLVQTKSEWPKYFAGIFYIFNPFFYERLVNGQIFLLLGYALFPWAMKTAIIFFSSPNFKQSLKVGLWLGLLALVNFHTIFFFGLFLLIYFLAVIIKNPKANFYLAKFFLLIIFIALLVNSFWLAPFFLQKNTYFNQANSIIGDGDLEIFKSQADPKFGLALNIAALYGFWGEGRGSYMDLKAIQPFWFEISMIIFAVAVIGTAVYFKKRENRDLGIALVALCILSFFISISTNFKFLHPFFQNIFFRIFRDPQKFVSFLALAYAFFGAWALDYFLLKIKKSFYVNLIVIIFLALPLFNSFILFSGLKGQFFSVEYPASWNEINEILNRDKDDFKTLFFPWHSYMSFNFVKNKLITNPAQCPTNCFFDKLIIVSNDIEVSGVGSLIIDPSSVFIQEQILTKRNQISDLGRLIKPYGIKYIILAEEVDYEDYKFLEKQEDLKMIYNKDRLRLYLNLVW